MNINLGKIAFLIGKNKDGLNDIQKAQFEQAKTQQAQNATKHREFGEAVNAAAVAVGGWDNYTEEMYDADFPTESRHDHSRASMFSTLF